MGLNVHLRHAARWLGFEPPGPLVPVDALAGAEPGIVTVECVAPERWVPREFEGDPRLARVATMLAEGEPWDRVAKRLTPDDRRALDELAAGRLDPRRAPPHVAAPLPGPPCMTTSRAPLLVGST